MTAKIPFHWNPEKSIQDCINLLDYLHRDSPTLADDTKTVCEYLLPKPDSDK